MSGTLESPLASSDGSLEADSRVGTVLGDRYRIDSLLGEGGMGRVYAAEHVLMRKRLAIKVLHRELTCVPEVVARFEREAMAAANIDHPNVAAATDFGKLTDGAVFLVLEYVQGVNLRDEIAKGPMSFDRALNVARQIASALGSAHALDIVHRDLKPENVMLVEKGGEADFVKVLDFGIAKVPIGEVGGGGEHRPITKVGMVFGTPEYMAPEQALGQAVDGRADLYALGVILYEMLAGVRPFSSKSQVGILGQQLSKPVPRFAERAPGIPVPPQVEQIVLRLLEKEVGDRFQSATDVVDVLDSLLGPAPALSGRKLTLAGGSPAAYGSQPWINAGSVPDLLASSPGLSSSPSWSDGAIPIMPNSSAPDAGMLPLPPLPVPPAMPSSRSSLASIESTVSGAYDAVVSPPTGTSLHRVYGWIEQRRDALPPALRGPLKSVPAPAFLGGAVLVLAGLVLVVVIGLGAALSHHADGKSPVVGAPSASGEMPTVTPSPTAPPAPELEAARKKGASAVEELAGRYPKDANLQVELSKSYMLERKHPEAVSAVGRAIALDPSLARSPDVASALWVTAQSKESADSAFALLEGPMGAKGADILYDLVTTDGIGGTVKQRAETWLKTEQFQKNSSPALNVAVALRFAKECSQRYALLLRAKNVGDKRSLKYLRLYQSHVGCGRHGKQDCQPCLRHDGRLEETIDAIEKRDHG